MPSTARSCWSCRWARTCSTLNAGPEYKFQNGYFTLERNANDTKTIEMQRFVEMKKEGWWSGDLHIHRPPADIELLMRAEDLHIGPVITWWNNRQPVARQEAARKTARSVRRRPVLSPAGRRRRARRRRIVVFQPAAAAADRRLEARVSLARQISGAWPAKRPASTSMSKSRSGGTCRCGSRPAKSTRWAWPTTIEHRDGMLDNEAWGKPRDTALFPSPHGNGRWSEHIYYQLLNCGLRIPPSAGSASGVLPNPVGYNRVYVHCGEELTWDKWWENLRRGQVVVTNGPLLRPRVFGPGAEQEGALPGHMFQADKGKAVEVQIELKLSTRDPIDYLEVVQDGKTVHEVRLDQWAKAGGNLPPLQVQHQRLVFDSGRDEQPQDVSLRQHRPVLCRDRLRAAREQEVGPILRRLGL